MEMSAFSLRVNEILFSHSSGVQGGAWVWFQKFQHLGT